MNFFYVDADTPMWEKEISETEYHKIFHDSEVERHGYTTEADAIIYAVADDASKDEWDNEQITLAAYKRNDIWYSVPQAFEDMCVKLI